MLRAIRVLGFADACKFRVWQLSTSARNKGFAREVPGFATPPPHVAFDALNHVDWHIYRDTGIAHAELFARAICLACPGDTPLDVLEWGCGPGRIVRHVLAALGDRAGSVTATDCNTESIAWCRDNLPGVHFAQNDPHPPLPFVAASFDAVYCFSVFTHLSEAAQIAWARELRRVLRPGGILVCTTQGAAFRFLLASGAERARFDSGAVVVQGNYQEGKKWFIAIQPEAFVKQSLLGEFVDVHRFTTTTDDDILQDVWVASASKV